MSSIITTLGRKKFYRRLLRAYNGSETQADYTKAFLNLINQIMEESDKDLNPLRLFRLNADNQTILEIILNDQGETQDKPC